MIDFFRGSMATSLGFLEDFELSSPQSLLQHIFGFSRDYERNIVQYEYYQIEPLLF